MPQCPTRCFDLKPRAPGLFSIVKERFIALCLKSQIANPKYLVHPPSLPRPPTLPMIRDFDCMSIITHQLTDFPTGSILAVLGIMSYRRVIIGVLIGVSLVAGGLVAAWRFGWPLEVVPGILFVVAVIYAGILCEIHRTRALRPYRECGCMSIRWRRRFPGDPKSEIRGFLRLFLEAFALRKRWLSRFSPDDRVMEGLSGVIPCWLRLRRRNGVGNVRHEIEETVRSI